MFTVYKTPYDEFKEAMSSHQAFVARVNRIYENKVKEAERDTKPKNHK